MNIKNYSLNFDKAPVMAREGDKMWLGVLESGVAKLRQVSTFNTKQIFFDIETNFTEIKRILVSGSYVYLALDDDEYIGARYNKTNPLSSYNYLAIPSGVNEGAVDLTLDGSNLFLLTPGNASGENAKVIKFVGTSFDETIDLSVGNPIVQATSITVDGSNNLWVVTYESPARLVKIYEGTGGIYTYESQDILS